MDSTSVNLLRRLREPQAETAWQRFVELYAPLIFHWGRQQGLNATDATDLVQDVFVTLIEKLPEFEYDPNQRFRGWLRTIAVHRGSDLRRRQNIRPQTGFDDAIQRQPDTAADLFVEEEYRCLLVYRALELLRTEFRETTWQAGWLQIVEAQKPLAVAQQLKLPLNAVYLAKSRILARLREELDGLLD